MFTVVECLTPSTFGTVSNTYRKVVRGCYPQGVSLLFLSRSCLPPLPSLVGVVEWIVHEINI